METPPSVPATRTPPSVKDALVAKDPARALPPGHPRDLPTRTPVDKKHPPTVVRLNLPRPYPRAPSKLLPTQVVALEFPMDRATTADNPDTCLPNVQSDSPKPAASIPCTRRTMLATFATVRHTALPTAIPAQSPLLSRVRRLLLSIPCGSLRPATPRKDPCQHRLPKRSASTSSLRRCTSLAPTSQHPSPAWLPTPCLPRRPLHAEANPVVKARADDDVRNPVPPFTTPRR